MKWETLEKDLVRTRATIVLVSAVAGLSFVTGLVNISTTSVSGPLSNFIPSWVQQVAGFTGIITGFLMTISALGLRKRLELAKNATFILLPLTAFQGIVQSSIVSYPLVLLSLISIPSLIANRKYFDKKANLTPVQTASLISVIAVQFYGTLGTLALNEGFKQNLTWIDAFYFSIVTSSTVGYGDINPVTPEARLFTTSLIILGTTSFAAAIGSIASPLIENKLAEKFDELEEELEEEIKSS